MNRESLIEYFINIFPEYRSALKQHLEDYDEVLMHVFFGDTVNERLIELLEFDEGNNKELQKLFNFLEKMALEGDLDVQEVLAVTILERLGDDKSLLENAYKYMGENTKVASKEIEGFWGRM